MIRRPPRSTLFPTRRSSDLFALASATKESAKANPDIEYVLIDDSADGGDDGATFDGKADRSEEHTSELQSHVNLVCRLLLEKKKICLHGPAAARIHTKMTRV